MAYRNSVNSTAGFTPAMLTFGHELRIPLDIVYGKCPQEECDYTEYVSELRKRLHIAFEKVHENTVHAQRRQKDYYDKNVSGKEIDVGNRIMLYTPSVKIE